jgi:hypothetical protein
MVKNHRKVLMWGAVGGVVVAALLCIWCVAQGRYGLAALNAVVVASCAANYTVLALFK